MGGACGCADTVEKSNELSIEQDEIRRRLHQDGSSINEEALKVLLTKVHLIVRMQAFFRGTMVRRRFRARLTKRSFAPRSMMSYASVDTNALIGNG